MAKAVPATAGRGQEAAEAAPAAKGGRGKLLLLGAAVLVVLGLGGGAAAYLLGLFGGGKAESGAEAHAEAEGEPVLDWHGNPVPTPPDSPVQLRCGQVPMLRGRVGRAGDRLAIEIEERLDRKEANGSD